MALQQIGGHRKDWETLADQIIMSPPEWRWWIRRHPASTTKQNEEFGRLLELRLPNVLIEEAAIPLTSLLRLVQVVISLESGTSVEAARFGIPSLFLSPAASELFADLIDKGQARTIDVTAVSAELAGLSRQAPLTPNDPGIESAFEHLSKLSGPSIYGNWQ